MLIHNRRSILDLCMTQPVMSHLKPENAATNKRAYKVFRNVIKDPDNAYSSKIAERMEISQGDVSHILTVLTEEELLQKGKKTRAQYYKPDHTGLVKYQAKLLGSDNNLDTEILENYVNLYIRFNRHSSLKEMLCDDFISIFLDYSNKEDVESHEVYEFINSLDTAELYDRRFFEIAEKVIEDSE